MFSDAMAVNGMVSSMVLWWFLVPPILLFKEEVTISLHLETLVYTMSPAFLLDIVFESVQVRYQF